MDASPRSTIHIDSKSFLKKRLWFSRISIHGSQPRDSQLVIIRKRYCFDHALASSFCAGLPCTLRPAPLNTAGVLGLSSQFNVCLISTARYRKQSDVKVGPHQSRHELYALIDHLARLRQAPLALAQHPVRKHIRRGRSGVAGQRVARQHCSIRYENAGRYQTLMTFTGRRRRRTLSESTHSARCLFASSSDSYLRRIFRTSAGRGLCSTERLPWIM